MERGVDNINRDQLAAQIVPQVGSCPLFFFVFGALYQSIEILTGSRFGAWSRQKWDDAARARRPR